MGTRILIPSNETLTDLDAHKIMLCSWCKRYFDPETKEYVPEPEKSSGDSICPKCMTEMMEELQK